MVALSEVSKMFWGVTLDGGGKHYTQTVECGFHISMAALELSHSKETKDCFVSIMIQHEKAEFVLCTLQHGHLLQQPLDLNFTEGEEITFFLNGKGIVHLTGYLVEDAPEQGMDYGEMDDMSGESEEESYEESDEASEESDDEAPQLTTATIAGVDSDDSDEDDDDYAPVKTSGKRKKNEDAKKPSKKPRVEEMNDDDDDDDDDDEDMDSYMKFIDDEAEEGSDTSDEDDSDLDEEDEENLARLSGSFLQAKKSATPKDKKSEKTPGKKQKEAEKIAKDTPKDKKQTPGKKQKGKETPVAEKKEGKQKGSEKKGATSEKKQKPDTPASPSASELDTSQVNSEKKKKKKKNKKNKLENGGGDASTKQTSATKQKPQEKSTTPAAGQKQQSKPGTPVTGQKAGKAQKKVLEGGVLCEDSKDGHGPLATPGKMVHVYYTGRLENGKVFDSSTGGTPFKFKLGKSEVIKGWDVGVKGMKVGGKRKLTIPAKMGYGNQRSGPIPPGSTLIFDVELKSVS